MSKGTFLMHTVMPHGGYILGSLQACTDLCEKLKFVRGLWGKTALAVAHLWRRWGERGKQNRQKTEEKRGENFFVSRQELPFCWRKKEVPCGEARRPGTASPEGRWAGGRALRCRRAPEGGRPKGREKGRENPAEAAARPGGGAREQRPHVYATPALLIYRCWSILVFFSPKKGLLSGCLMRISLFVLKNKKNPSQIRFSQHPEFVLKYMRVFKYLN